MSELAQSILWKNFFRAHEKEDDSLKSLLSKVPIFSQLTRKELRNVVAIVHRREYSAKERIFSQGDPGLGMYVIESGEVEVIYCDSGAEKSLAILEAGDFFGELSLLDESPRSATAITREHTRIIGFFRPDLIALLDKSPVVATKILFKLGEVIGTRLRITNEHLGKLSAEFEKYRSGGKNADS